VRFSMKDQPGTLAKVAAVLGAHGIGIDSVMQQEAPADAEYVPVIFVTGKAAERALADALTQIQALDGVIDRAPVRYRIEDSD